MTKALMKRPCVALMKIPKPVRWVMCNPSPADEDPEDFHSGDPELDEILDQFMRAFEWDPPRAWEVA